MPKVKRGAPRTGSSPIMASSRPSTVISRAAIMLRPASPIDEAEARPPSGAKNSAGPNFSASVASGMATTTSAMVASVPPTNEPMAAMPSAEPARPCRAICVAVDAGYDRRGLARHVDQHRGDRAAIHRAVVDGAQHDDGAGGVEAEGERDQDRRAGRRSEAGQHADQRAEHAAGEGEQQVVPGAAPPRSPDSRWPRASIGLDPEPAGRQEHVQPAW